MKGFNLNFLICKGTGVSKASSLQIFYDLKAFKGGYKSLISRLATTDLEKKKKKKERKAGSDAVEAASL